MENPSARWAPRGLIHGYAVLNDELYIVGGGIKGSISSEVTLSHTTAEYNDVWKTSDGKTWNRVTAHAPFAARTHYSLTAYNNMLWITDGSVGDQAILSNETWYSSDGLNWKQIKYPFLVKARK
ncbi:MAG: hypothetical protein HC905_27590 [Bacteroidales bacterium]|nr:hypothetical protein [Bacteroidales bacterium]